MKRLLLLLLTLALVGCSKKEPEPEPTEPEPTYLGIEQVTFSDYGDNVILEITQNEGFNSVDDHSAELVVDKATGDVVYIDYIQGNSLNNFVQAYYSSTIDATKSNLEDDVFMTRNKCYAFYVSGKNNIVMITGDSSLKDKCSELRDRLVET